LGTAPDGEFDKKQELFLVGNVTPTPKMNEALATHKLLSFE